MAVNPKRVNYYSGQLLTPADLQDEQAYFIETHKRHNRFIHGSGVAAGLQVSISNGTPGAVMVEPGYALDAEGHEVVVSTTQRGPFPANGEKAYLCIYWAERETDFIPALTSESEREEPIASRVEEYAELKYEARRPSATLKDPYDAGASPGNHLGIALARLVKMQGMWRLDKRFRVRRVRA
jgi:hypothetical protein